MTQSGSYLSRGEVTKRDTSGSPGSSTQEDLSMKDPSLSMKEPSLLDTKGSPLSRLTQKDPMSP